MIFRVDKIVYCEWVFYSEIKRRVKACIVIPHLNQTEYNKRNQGTEYIFYFPAFHCFYTSVGVVNLCGISESYGIVYAGTYWIYRKRRTAKNSDCEKQRCKRYFCKGYFSASYYVWRYKEVRTESRECKAGRYWYFIEKRTPDTVPYSADCKKNYKSCDITAGRYTSEPAFYYCIVGLCKENKTQCRENQYSDIRREETACYKVIWQEKQYNRSYSVIWVIFLVIENVVPFIIRYFTFTQLSVITVFWFKEFLWRFVHKWNLTRIKGKY